MASQGPCPAETLIDENTKFALERQGRHARLKSGGRRSAQTPRQGRSPSGKILSTGSANLEQGRLKHLSTDGLFSVNLTTASRSRLRPSLSRNLGQHTSCGCQPVILPVSWRSTSRRKVASATQRNHKVQVSRRAVYRLARPAATLFDGSRPTGEAPPTIWRLGPVGGHTRPKWFSAGSTRLHAVTATLMLLDSSETEGIS